MITPESKFLHELETFRKEAEGAIQFWYSHLSIHAVASKNSKVHSALNQHALFWNTTLGALQASAFMTLGRIFDQGSKHNIDLLIQCAQRNSSIFSLSALRSRKILGSPNATEWIDEYMQSAYEPSPEDFRRLRKHINRYRKIYDSKYKDIRHQVYAHHGASDESEVISLFAKTNITEMQKMFVFLKQFHESLWQLFFNGRKPILRQMRFSSSRMLKMPLAKHSPQYIQDRIVQDTKDLLLSLASNHA